MTMIKKIFLSVLLCTVCMFGMAQSQTVTHVVQRGETLESIAEYYKVSVEDINKANPNADGIVYVGMKLNIPTNSNNSIKKDIAVSKDYQRTNETNTISRKEITTTSQSTKNNYSANKTSTDLNDYSLYSLFYRASFEDAGTGFYGLGGIAFTSSGWGVNFYIGADYGLAEKHYEGVCFYIGPSYGYNFNNILLIGSLDFVGIYAGQGEGKQTGTNHKGETYTYTGTKNKFGWGIALSPQVGIKLNKVTPYLGLDFNWTKDAKKIDVGFCVGVGFDI